MNAILQNKYIGDTDEWILNVIPTAKGFICSSSSGTIKQYEWALPQPSIIKAHDSSISSIKNNDENSLVSCSSDGVKLWDLRTSNIVQSFENHNNNLFLSVAIRDNLIAGGTELIGSDSELHLWDIRNPKKVVKSFTDSHHDDITDLKFHPRVSEYLMSGSTDGYVNIYNLNETDEDEALHQVINYCSVHSCNFINDHRIAILSHMETLSFHSLNNTNYEVIQEEPMNDIGDLRALWSNCEYVIDINGEGYVSYGANSEAKLTMARFNPHQETFGQVINFPGAHGEEVVRDLQVVGQKCLTCGEDGLVKVWDLPFTIAQPPSDVITSSQPVAVNETTPVNPSPNLKPVIKKSHKRDKHKKKDNRFKPY